MFKRALLSAILVFSLIVPFGFADCFLDSYSADCQRLSSPFMEFELDFSSDELVDSYSAVLYDKSNPSNRLTVDIQGDTVRNLVPFTEPGVYVLEVRATTLSNRVAIESQEFIFDNADPLPPQVPMMLYSDSTSLQVQGVTIPFATVVAESTSGIFIATANAQGTYVLDLTFPQGVSVAQFYTEVSGVRSEKIGRVAYSGIDPFSINSNSVINSIQLDDLSSTNERTYFESSSYLTSKRFFVVSGDVVGTNVEGALVRVQGLEVVADSTGAFASYVLLNEGLNQIEIKAGDETEVINVLYTVPRFQFTSLDFDKVTSSDVSTMTVGVNYQIPYAVYLNGELATQVTPTTFEQDVLVTGLRDGKNYITFVGTNGELFTDFIYKDNALPTIEYVGFTQLTSSDELIFRVRDDLSVDFDTFNVDVGPQTITSDNVEFRGDYVFVPVGELPEGTSSFTTSISDVVGNSGSTSGQVEINPRFAVIDTIIISDGEVVGDTLFVPSGQQVLQLDPSQFIAFDKIFLDGAEVTSYFIQRNGVVELTANFSQVEGELTLSYIDSSRNYMSKSYKYITDKERPEFVLDYVSSAYVTEESTVRVSGRVIDSYFDWQSLQFNSQDSFIRYGDYVEAFVSLTTSGENNLIVSGKDMTNNVIDDSTYGRLLFLDTTRTDFSFDTLATSSYEGSFLNTPQEVRQYVSSYDGIDLRRSYVLNDFSLPLGQREGIRSVNLKSVESSGMTSFALDPVSTDNIPPHIYVFNDTELRIVLDGTLSPLDLSSLEIDINGIPLSILPGCSEYSRVGVYDDCRAISASNLDEIRVRVEDDLSNEATRAFILGQDTFDVPPSQVSPIDLYFVGNDRLVVKDSFFVQGQIHTQTPPTSVYSHYDDCLFDDIAFVCYFPASVGENEVQVTVVNEAGNQNSSNYTVIRTTGDDLIITLDDLTNSAIFDVNGDYYTLIPEVDILGQVSQDALVTLIVDGRELPVGEYEGSFVIPVDLGDHLTAKNREELDIQLRAEDELGNTARSDSVLLIFSRFAETVLDVLIG